MSLTMPGPTKTCLLLTRPIAQSRRFAAEIEARFGERFDCVLSPMVAIVDLPAQVDFAGYDGAVFTSQNGVAAYARLGGPAGKTAYCVGARTAEAATALGLRAVSSQGDVAALNDLLSREAVGQRLVHISGADVAGKVAGDVTRVVAYKQVAVPLNEVGTRLIQGKPPVVVCVFSPNAARFFGVALPSEATAPLTALCLSTAVAGGLPPGRFDRVEVAQSPNATALMDKLSDMFPL